MDNLELIAKRYRDFDVIDGDDVEWLVAEVKQSRARAAELEDCFWNCFNDGLLLSTVVPCASLQAAMGAAAESQKRKDAMICPTCERVGNDPA